MNAQCIIFISIFISRTYQQKISADYRKTNDSSVNQDVHDNQLVENNFTTNDYSTEDNNPGNEDDDTQSDNENNIQNDLDQYDDENNIKNVEDTDQKDNENDPDQYDENDPDQQDSENDPDQYYNENDPDQQDNENDPDQYYSENDSDQYDDENDPDQYYSENDTDQQDNDSDNQNDSYDDDDNIGAPQSSEIPEYEQGFDLSQDDIVKLKLWPDGFIPYYIDVFSFSDKVMRDKIRGFLSSVNSLTALNFVEMPSPPLDNSRWVFFVNRRGLLGCADHSIRNFTNVGVQHVVLGYHCMNNEGELAEAVLSIAGVPAQHNAPDRDYYIKIKEENIIPEKKYLFIKHYDNEWLFHDLEYDFHSAGHFHSYKHSMNGWATIIPQTALGPVTLGESTALTAIDIKKLRMLYNYIGIKRQFVASDCAKLFEPGENFEASKPKEFSIPPRPKPFRFVGESPDEPLDSQDIKIIPGQSGTEDQAIEYSSSGNPELFTCGTEEDAQNTKEPINDVKNPNGITNNPVKDILALENDYEDDNQNEIPQVPEEPDESENVSPNDYQSDDSVKGRTPTIVHLAVNTKSTLVNLIGYKQVKKNKDRPDPLTALSDFNTDEEKVERKKKIQNSTLQESQDLKFKVPG